jgi:dihydroorotase
VVGLETAVSLCLDRLVRPALLSLPRLVDALSAAPARLLGLPGGSLVEGAPADLTVLDLERKVKVDPARFESKGRHTPFTGWTLRGAPVLTVVDGRVVFSALRR